MFKVECPSCNAPYQVDERRVPEAGLTMRCPKCSTSFLVRSPSAQADLPAPVTPSPRQDFRGTMIGVPNVFAASPPLGAPTGTPKARDPRLSGTMIGLSSPLGPSAPRAGRLSGTMIGIAGPNSPQAPVLPTSTPPLAQGTAPNNATAPTKTAAPSSKTLSLGTAPDSVPMSRDVGSSSHDDLPSVLGGSLPDRKSGTAAAETPKALANKLESARADLPAPRVPATSTLSGPASRSPFSVPRPGLGSPARPATEAKGSSDSLAPGLPAVSKGPASPGPSKGAASTAASAGSSASNAAATAAKGAANTKSPSTDGIGLPARAGTPGTDLPALAPEKLRGLLGKFPSVAQFDDEVEPPAPSSSVALPARKSNTFEDLPAKSFDKPKSPTPLGGTPKPSAKPSIKPVSERNPSHLGYPDRDLPSVLSALDELDLDAVLPSVSAPLPAASARSAPSPGPAARPAPPGPVARPVAAPPTPAARAKVLPSAPPLLDDDIEDIPLESLPPSMPPEPMRLSDVGELLDLDEVESMPMSVAGADAFLPAPRDHLDLPSPLDDFDLGMPSMGSAGFGDVGFGDVGFGDVGLSPSSNKGSSIAAGSSHAEEEWASLGVSSHPPSSEFDAFAALPKFDDLAEPSVPPIAHTPGRAGAVTQTLGSLDPAVGGPVAISAREDDYEEDLPPVSARHARDMQHSASSVQRGVVSGAGYGELDLGGDDSLPSGSDAGMEFGDIPQAEEGAAPEAPGAVALDARPLENAPALKEKSERRRHDASLGQSVTTPRKRWKGVAVAMLGVTLVGGGLSLLPEVGPFGVYFLSDQLQRGANVERLSKAAADAAKLRSLDQFPDAGKAVRVVSAARAESKRFKPLAAYEAYARYAQVVRFGAQTEMQSAAQVTLDELTRLGVSSELPEFALAQSADQVVRGSADKARGLLAGVKGKVAELDRLTLLGELELREGRAAEAEVVWRQAVAVKSCPWTLFGLVRAQWLAAQIPAVQQGIGQVLALNPEHVGARLLQAEVAWKDHNEQSALADIERVLAAKAQASATELVVAQTLLGEIHLDRGRVSRAEATFGEALQIDPKAPRALLGLGETFYSAGQLPAALARFEATVAAEPKSILGKLGMVKTLLASELVDRAKQLLTELQQQNPNHAEIMYWRGKLLENAAQVDEARAAYQFAIEHASETRVRVDAYVARAQFEAKAGHVDDAANLLREALKALPQSARLRKALGEVALTQGRYDEALSEFQRAEQLDPADVGAAFRVGSAYRRLGKYEEAWKAFEQVATRDAELPGLPLERGLLLEQSGKSADALKEYEIALTRAPNDPDVLLRVGCARVAKGDGKGAEAALGELLKTQPRSPEVNYCAGRAMFLQGKHLEALKRLQQAVDIDGTRAEYHLYVGWVASEAGQVAVAQQQLDEALALDQGLADAYWQRGALSLKQGASVDAVTDLKRALKLRPERFEAHADLAQAYTQLGREREALAEWQIAMAGDDKNPTWLFRYGKLLSAEHKNDEAGKRLAAAVELGEKAEEPPAWLWQAHYLLAVSMGGGPAAYPHYRRFLETGPVDSPYRGEAKRALSHSSEPWQGK